MDYDVVIVGSGPGGTAAALALANCDLKIGLVDVGFDAPDALWPESFDEALRNPAPWRGQLLGLKHEYIQALQEDSPIAKLGAPLQSFVTRESNLTPVIGHGFHAVVSHALGGLANVWGAQMLRYNADDLREFPLPPSALTLHYDVIESEMGLSGCNDDLTRFYGTNHSLQPSLRLNPNAEDLLKRYGRQRRRLNRAGVFIGHPRTAIQTQDKGSRPTTAYDGLEFFRPRSPAIYTPAFTLRRLIQRSQIAYLPSLLALRFDENERGARLHVRQLTKGAQTTINARKLILAAGAFGSARLVLASNEDYRSRLPLMDNLLSYIPFINPLRLGRTRDTKTSYLQLNLCFQPPDEPLTMGSFYAINGLLHADFVNYLPLQMADSLRLLPHVVPAMLILHLWHSDRADLSRSWVQLDQDGVLHAYRRDRLTGRVEDRLIRLLSLLGFFSFPRLVQFPKPGNSFHRCGTLPMCANPVRYETGPDGRLGSTTHVFVADASVLPWLSAKNPSLTVMANAHRVAQQLADNL